MMKNWHNSPLDRDIKTIAIDMVDAGLPAAFVLRVLELARQSEGVGATGNRGHSSALIYQPAQVFLLGQPHSTGSQLRWTCLLLANDR